MAQAYLDWSACLFDPPGVVSVLLTSPLWVVNTRLKVQTLRCYSEDVLPTRYSGFMGKCMTMPHPEVVFFQHVSLGLLLVLQMQSCRSPLRRAWQRCGAAPLRPCCWCPTPPSSSWFTRDWRGIWDGSFPERWVGKWERLAGDYRSSHVSR